ncbi:hypothetical protein [Actinoalloteichus hymeniacidonis]|uniref:Uncharacterized protein n=1 Tax=Actinoalloteichus hymeniacidonis TaxID=340345 RepID=A0AAC9HTG5_9PSEU|nr:hypothetical protein [Actinoalloteichus hymeniacidonis]AOS65367.1 hypothetical protein TL08_22935 [Actinoalloteichus hymeniacidonis]MBB5906547.1 hypothetical protein [Actinoalloteichus hymeniacidonis]
MPSKTSRTLQAAVMAAGFAAMGAGTAMATDATDRLPSKADVPTDIGAELPLHSCQSPAYAVTGSEIVPCADVTAKASIPNVFVQPAYTLEGTALALADQFTTPGPLLDVNRVNRLGGALGTEVAEVTALQRTRPDIALDVAPGNTGVLDQSTSDTLLSTRLRERPENYSGFSAVDTAVEINAVEGYTLGQPLDPNTITRPVTGAVSGGPLGSTPTLPETADVPVVGPAADQALTRISSDIDGVREAAPLGEVTGTVSGVVDGLGRQNPVTDLARETTSTARQGTEQLGDLGGVLRPVTGLLPAEVSSLIDPAASAPSTLPAPADAVGGVADSARQLPLTDAIGEAGSMISTNPVGNLLGNVNAPKPGAAAPAPAPEPTVEHHVRQPNKAPELNALHGSGLGELVGGGLTVPSSLEAPKTQSPLSTPSLTEVPAAAGSLTQPLIGKLPI